jgi:CubicO group peptidase (beta-lactamase class C family)
MKRKLLAGLILIILAGLIYGIVYLNSLMPVVTGYPAKYLCSAVFISGREPGAVEKLDLHFSLLRFTSNSVDYQEKSVTSRFLWGSSKAIFREGLGAVLVRETDEKILKKAEIQDLLQNHQAFDTLPWPFGNRLADSLTPKNSTGWNTVADKMFIGKSYGGTPFAMLVIHRGLPVLERYAPEFDRNTRFLSWSMAKSFTNTLTGMLVMEGKLSRDNPADIEEWGKDERKTITLNNLLRMESGLEWNEDYGNLSDVTRMLYKESDFAKYAFQRPLQSGPGATWYYSSGTTNIINHLIRNCFSSDEELYRYLHEKLFHRTGMADAIFETDATGNLVGSSYVFATLRDYGRFGLLYLNDGIFTGERLLPEGWVEYTRTPSPKSQGAYGAHFWLNRNHFYPDAPEDMFSANGHDGQRIFIIPSKELVVVILGYSPKQSMDFNAMLKDILARAG